MSEELLKGRLTISRTTYSNRDSNIRIAITDEKSGGYVTEVFISLEDFAAAVTGQSVSCEFEKPSAFVGMERETKKVLVRGSSVEERLTAFRALEVDGWKGRERDLHNWHNLTSDGVYVWFERYV